MSRRRTSRLANYRRADDHYTAVMPNESIKPLKEFTKDIEDGIRDAMLDLLKQPTMGFTYTPEAMHRLSLLYVQIGQRYHDMQALRDQRVFDQMYGFYSMVSQAQDRVIDMLRKGVLK